MLGRISFIAALMILIAMVFASFKSFHASDFSNSAVPVAVAMNRRAATPAGLGSGYQPPPIYPGVAPAPHDAIPASPPNPQVDANYPPPGIVQPAPDDNSQAAVPDSNNDDNNNDSADNNDPQPDPGAAWQQPQQSDDQSTDQPTLSGMPGVVIPGTPPPD